MKKALKSITGGASSSANVVDGKLILSFPDAITPVVWQMDLTEAKASAMEVTTKDEGKSYTLTLKSPDGEAVDIAPFKERADAVDGLMAVSRALENAHGQIRPVAQGSAPETVSVSVPKRGSSGKLLPAFLGVLLVLVLLTIWGSMAARGPGGLRPAGLNTTAAQSPNAAGVPVSAEEFLRGR